MSLLSAFQEEIVSKKAYIKLSILEPRHISNNYTIPIPLPGVSAGETLTEIASLIFSDLISAILPTAINFIWRTPSNLPGYTTSQVVDMRVGGQGYLYFALGADNQSKAVEQVVNIPRLRQIYRMTEPQIINQIALLLIANVCTIDLNSVAVQWLNKSVDESSTSIASHELSVNHPIVTSTSKGMMTSEMLARLNAPVQTGLDQRDRVKLDSIENFATANDTNAQLRNRTNHTGTQDAQTTITGLGDFAFKNFLTVGDVPALPSSKITGLGSFALKNTIMVADVPALPASSITGLDAAIASKQDLLSSTSNLSINQIVTVSKISAVPAAVIVAAASTITANREIILVTSTSSLEMTSATPITTGVEGQKLTIVNSGNFSIYIQALEIGLRPKTSASFIYSSGWIAIAIPQTSQNLPLDSQFIFKNGALVNLLSDKSFFLVNAAGVNQTQDPSLIGMRVNYQRGIIVQDNNGWYRVPGFYKYNLGINSFTLPPVLSNIAEYKCF